MSTRCKLLPGAEINGKTIVRETTFMGRPYFVVRYSCCGVEKTVSRDTLKKRGSGRCVRCLRKANR